MVNFLTVLDSIWPQASFLDMYTVHMIVHQAFMEGKFAVKQTPQCFNGVGADMALEQQIINRSQKVFHVSLEALGRSSTWLVRIFVFLVYFLLFLASDCLERFVSEMTYYVSSGT